MVRGSGVQVGWRLAGGQWVSVARAGADRVGRRVVRLGAGAWGEDAYTVIHLPQKGFTQNYTKAPIFRRLIGDIHTYTENRG